MPMPVSLAVKVMASWPSSVSWPSTRKGTVRKLAGCSWATQGDSDRYDLFSVEVRETDSSGVVYYGD